MKRSISIDSIDGVCLGDLEISKVAKVKLQNDSFIHLDQLKDGTWRLLYTENLIPDFTKISGFTVHRED